MEKQTIITILLIITVILSVSSIAITFNTDTKNIQPTVIPETQNGNVQLNLEKAPMAEIGEAQ